MSTRPRRLFLAVTIVIALAACAPGDAVSPSVASDAPETSAPAASASAEAPTEPSSADSAVGQTDTDWGRIWDALPASFPRYPGSTPADDAAPEPASARFAVPGGDPAAIATWMQDALETATFSTLGLNGPMEDGGYVIDSTGEGDCRLQTTITPLGDMTFITVLYGADCPAA